MARSLASEGRDAFGAELYSENLEHFLLAKPVCYMQSAVVRGASGGRFFVAVARTPALFSTRSYLEHVSPFQMHSFVAEVRALQEQREKTSWV